MGVTQIYGSYSVYGAFQVQVAFLLFLPSLSLDCEIGILLKGKCVYSEIAIVLNFVMMANFS